LLGRASLDIRQEMEDSVVEHRGEGKMAPSTDLLQGTLDMLILQTLAPGQEHGWAIAQRIQQMSNDVLQVGQGSRATPSGIQGLDPRRVGRIRE
jgi:hypothetical protein